MFDFIEDLLRFINNTSAIIPSRPFSSICLPISSDVTCKYHNLPEILMSSFSFIHQFMEQTKCFYKKTQNVADR